MMLYKKKKKNKKARKLIPGLFSKCMHNTSYDKKNQMISELN